MSIRYYYRYAQVLLVVFSSSAIVEFRSLYCPITLADLRGHFMTSKLRYFIREIFVTLQLFRTRLLRHLIGQKQKLHDIGFRDI